MNPNKIKEKIQKYINFPDKESREVLQGMLDELSKPDSKDFCGKERPNRKVICQLKKGHKGSHRAVIFWEG